MHELPLTVLMPVHNGARWLEEAIASVLCQQHRDFEFLVVNDGSTDGTCGILQRLAARDSRLRVLNRERSGLVSCLNFGLGIARGEWVARVDADDLAEPARLAQQLEYVRKHPDVVLLGTIATEIDEAGRVTRLWNYPEHHQALIFSLVSGRGGPFPHSSVLFRRDVARRIGGYRARLKSGEDVDLWLRMSDEGKIACLQSRLVRIRKHANNMSRLDSLESLVLYTQIVLVSHQLRQIGAEDPVYDDVGSTVFESFVAFVAREVAAEGVPAARNFISELKVVRSLPGRRRAVHMLSCLLLRERRLLFRHLWCKLALHRVHARVAKRWLQSGGAVWR